MPFFIRRNADVETAEEKLRLRDVAAPPAPGKPGSQRSLLHRNKSSSALSAADDDDEETFFERLSNSDAVLRLSALSDRFFQLYFVAILMDVAGVLLFVFDIWTDALVVKALSQTEHTDWMIITLVFIMWHYVLMAVLVSAYIKRTTTKLNVLGLEEADSNLGAGAVLGSKRRYRWLLFLPLSVLGVALLDIAMVFTSILPILFPQTFANFSSFLSNYNFSRYFIEFVFESVPQTILQTYIYHKLSQSHLAGSTQQQTVLLSLGVSFINCIKYGWKLWKAADDAGLTMLEYFKYLLLLKGNYECSPSAMISAINEICSIRQLPLPSAGAAAAAAGGTGGSGTGSPASGPAPTEAVFVMNGFHLHRNKSQYGPAQQAYILLNAFDRMDGCPGIQRWVVSGCPLASMNRILEKGLRAFRNLTTLEVNECALRGDTWKIVHRAIKRHKHLEKVKLIQTGILAKYRNAKRHKVVAGLFKHSLRLRCVALCLHWWGEDYLQAAVELHLLDHPTLQSLAIELPPGAAFAARDPNTDPLGGAGGLGAGAAARGGASHSGRHGWGRRPRSSFGGDRANGSGGGAAAGAAGGCGGSGSAAGPRGRLAELAAMGTVGVAAPPSPPRQRHGAPWTSGGGSGNTVYGLSPFATDPAAAHAASAGAQRFSVASGGGGGGHSHGGGALLGWVAAAGSGALSDMASYISGATVSTIAGLTAVATGNPWSDGLDAAASAAAATADGTVASARYCWMLAAVLTSAPALKSLFIHNHALPEAAAEGAGQLAAALATNTRLTTLSLRGSTVGDAGAAALARALGPGGNATLTSLCLRRSRLHDEGVAALCACLVDNTSLRCLDLSHNRVSGPPAGPPPTANGQPPAAAPTANGHPRSGGSYTHAYFHRHSHSGTGGGGTGGGAAAAGGGGGGSGALAALERALRSNGYLSDLRLEGWRDTFDDPAAVSSLAAALARNTGLRSLSLAACRICDRGAALLASALTTNTALTVLNLSASCGDGGAVGGGGGAGGAAGGRIGDAGVAALATALCRNKTLKELYLEGCCCGEVGGAALGEALTVNCSLQILDLSWDGGGGLAAGALGAGTPRATGDGAAPGGGVGGLRSVSETGPGAGEGDGGAGAGGGGGAKGWSGGSAAVCGGLEHAEAGVSAAAATHIFTALQTNTSLRVLRMRGAAGLTLRAVRAAADALRLSPCLAELDLSNASFLAVDEAALAATASGAAATAGAVSAAGYGSGTGTQPPTPLAERPSVPITERTSLLSAVGGGGGGGGGGKGLGLRSSSMQSLGSSRSLASQPSLTLGQGQSPPTTPSASHPSLASLAEQHSGAPHPHPHAHPAASQPSASAPFAPSSFFRWHRTPSNNSIARTSAPHTPHTPGPLGPTSSIVSVGGVAALAAGAGPEVGLSREAVELLGSMWSALAGGLAVNTSLRVLRLANCGLGSVAAAALAPALMKNTTLVELDLSGLPAATARIQLAAVIARAAAALAVAAAAQRAAGLGAAAATPAPAAPGGAAAGFVQGGCSLTSIRVTNESYEVCDLLAAEKVTSRAAEEAAAAAEAERKKYDAFLRGNGAGTGGAGDGALLRDSGGSGGVGSSDGGVGRGGVRGWIGRWRRRG
ncbi:hypothetical protein HYH03_000491 [Edaphochlamys debaryana]|uniref:Uncharacterized protein n=1 Tax=Edaphochlamys debaryana TaxID=47281 RepID=A0A835YP35_9CHLO|nr:hypothetical protein HYH03_000491 [Edaphochlamys debaryana]|eukprot:KAG2501995.1 hypothetical protein HYH03_000491 [Edaphochlamys debaryana]